MLRLAIITLAVVVGVLLLVSLLPKAPRVIPDSTIHLENTTLTLYPQEDPDAVWFFNSPTVEYNPDSRETTLFKVQDGKRTVNDETDFTLESEKVTIGSDDNMYGERIAVYIPDGDYDLDMQSKDGSQVFINQSAGEFEVPRLDMTSGSDTSTYERVRMSFDIESFSAGGEGTVGYSQFEIGESDGQ
jgi:hypothetical protein